MAYLERRVGKQELKTKRAAIVLATFLSIASGLSFYNDYGTLWSFGGGVLVIWGGVGLVYLVVYLGDRFGPR